MRKQIIQQEDLAIVNCVRVLIEKKYYQHYTHEELARIAGTNKKKLEVLFKEHTTKTIYEYLCLIRIEKAKELLISTDYSIKVIAGRIGLDRSNFIKLFKKSTNITPLAWRRDKRESNGSMQFVK